MNKKYLALFSFVLSVISPLVCFASSDGGSGASGIFKIIAVILVVLFLVTTALIVLFAKNMKK